MKVYLTYAAWRRSLPWTDAQLAEACRAEAQAAPNDFLRARYERHATRADQGSINRSILRLALPRLIQVCTICGKPALYRWGTEGRCRAHRLLKPSFIHDREQRIEQRDHAYDERERKRRRADSRYYFKQHQLIRRRNRS